MNDYKSHVWMMYVKIIFLLLSIRQNRVLKLLRPSLGFQKLFPLKFPDRWPKYNIFNCAIIIQKDESVNESVIEWFVNNKTPLISVISLSPDRFWIVVIYCQRVAYSFYGPVCLFTFQPVQKAGLGVTVTEWIIELIVDYSRVPLFFWN